MYSTGGSEDTKLALLAEIGSRAVRLGLTGEDGRLRRDTIRSYSPEEQSTISGALGAFADASHLPRLPRRCAIAVSGTPVGDTISVTNSRWIVSRSGLAAMLQAPPLILNDFAAHAWALSTSDSGARVEQIAGAPLRVAEPGTRCLIGVGSGLGVAVLTHGEDGHLGVLSTAAGHSHFMGEPPELKDLLQRMRVTNGAASAEDILSERGLLAIYREIAGPAAAQSTDAATIIRLGVSGHDVNARKTAELFVRTLWHFAGNMVLTYGAWNGVLFTGRIADALRPLIAKPGTGDNFLIRSPLQRRMRDVPRALVALDHAELRGAAQALLLH